MKTLYSLVVILSCSAVSLSISIPSIADTVKDNQIKSASTSIQNKDYRNKQSTPSMVGSWKALVNERGVATNIYFNVRSDGTYNSIHHSNGGRGSVNGNWEYSNNLLTQTDNQGVQKAQGTIKWISNDEFLLTIEDNGDPYYEGVQRRYYRQPVQTSQPVNDYSNYNSAVQSGRQIPGIMRGMKSWGP